LNLAAKGAGTTETADVNGKEKGNAGLPKKKGLNKRAHTEALWKTVIISEKREPHEKEPITVSQRGDAKTKGNGRRK